MRCQLCGEDKKLIKAHIIPQCLYTPLKNPSGPIMQVFKTPDTPPRRTPTGEYDTGILCADCDNHKLGCFDRYAGELLLKNLDVNTTKKYYVVQEYSYSSLKLFFLSVLWRMSVSTLPSVKKVKLGPFEAQIRDMLLRKDAGPPETFPIVLHRYIDDIGAQCMLDTQPGRSKDRKVYNVGLPGYLAVIKVDSRPIPPPIGPAVLRPAKPLLVIWRRIDEEPEWRFVKQIVENQKTSIRRC